MHNFTLPHHLRNLYVLHVPAINTVSELRAVRLHLEYDSHGALRWDGRSYGPDHAPPAERSPECFTFHMLQAGSKPWTDHQQATRRRQIEEYEDSFDGHRWSRFLDLAGQRIEDSDELQFGRCQVGYRK